MAVRVLDLRLARSWDLRELLPRTPSAIALPDYSGSLVTLGDVVMTLSPTRVSDTPATDVVTPQDVDSRTGRVAGTAARGGLNTFEVTPDGLQPGDVLVAQQPRIPALLLGDEHAGYSFSSRWLALRTTESTPVQPLVLWALLSCRTGAEARMRVATGTVTPRVNRGDLMNLLLPVPPADASVEVLRVIWRRTLDASPLAPARSWHGAADLRFNSRWNDMIRTHNAVTIAEGPSLQALGARIRSGSVRSKQMLPVRLAEAMPVLTVQAVRGDSELDAWAVPRVGEVIGERGDAVITTTGTRFRARLLAERSLVGKNLVLVQQLPSSDARRLVDYINSSMGQYALRQIVTGDYIPHLTLAALAHVVLPRASDAVARETEQESLADALEHALWPLFAG
jgi:hypothetical protein